MIIESQIKHDMEYFTPGNKTKSSGDSLAHLRTILRQNEIILEQKKLQRE